MSKDDNVEMEGVVTAEAGGGFFRISAQTKDGVGHEVLAKLCGKMREHKIRVIVGDRVTLEASPYDLTRGRITYRVRT